MDSDQPITYSCPVCHGYGHGYKKVGISYQKMDCEFCYGKKQLECVFGVSGKFIPDEFFEEIINDIIESRK